MFYVAIGLQLIGLALVGLCLFSGLVKGDYGQLEFVQLVGGSFVFYIGQFFKAKSS